MKRKRIFTIVIATVLTFLVMRIIIGLLAGDFAHSVIPGWHSIIYPAEMTLTVLTAILLVMTLMVVGVFKAVSFLISAFLKRVAR